MRFSIGVSHPPGASPERVILRKLGGMRRLAGCRFAVTSIDPRRTTTYVSIMLLTRRPPPARQVRDAVDEVYRGLAPVGKVWCSGLPEDGDKMNDDTREMVRSFFGFGFFLMMCFAVLRCC